MEGSWSDIEKLRRCTLKQSDSRATLFSGLWYLKSEDIEANIIVVREPESPRLLVRYDFVVWGSVRARTLRTSKIKRKISILYQNIRLNESLSDPIQNVFSNQLLEICNIDRFLEDTCTLICAFLRLYYCDWSFTYAFKPAVILPVIKRNGRGADALWVSVNESPTH